MVEDFESDYKIPEISNSNIKDNSIFFGSFGKEEIDEIYRRIDSILDWIKQFYDRFRYLEKEVATIKTKVNDNETLIDGIVDDNSRSSFVNFGADIQRLDRDLRILNEKVDRNASRVSEVVRDSRVVQEGVVTNELSSMNRKVNYNLEKSKSILAEVENVFSKMKRIKDDFERITSGYDNEDKLKKSKSVLDAWKKVPGLGDNFLKEPKIEKREYKRLVENGSEDSSCYPIGSKEWLRDIKKSSRG